MNCRLLFLLLSFATLNSGMAQQGLMRYAPTWTDLDTRPLPQWYDEAKIGIFLHWGIFSVPSFGSEWFWVLWNNKIKNYTEFMGKNYPAGFTYQDFAPLFTAEFFDANEWASLFRRAGAKYVVLTSKHHDGFALFPSKQSFVKWNSVDIGPRRDLVGELSKGVRAAGLKFGVYYSLYEWFNPLYAKDKKNGFKTIKYPKTKLWPDIRQLIYNYQPSILWADGDCEAKDTYWNSTALLAWMYSKKFIKDDIVTNDRWGKGCRGKHGDFYSYLYKSPGKLLSHKWENAFSLDSQSWGFRRNVALADIMSFDELLYQVVTTVSSGGNVLINIGPTKEGTIALIFQERLLSLGKWLNINGEAIYGTSPWLYQNDSARGDVWYTCRKSEYNATHPTTRPSIFNTVTAVYVIILKWPTNGHLIVTHLTSLHRGKYLISMLGYSGVLKWDVSNEKVHITLPKKAAVKSTNAWTLKISPIYLLPN